jgi:hypothetical protein
MRTCGVKFGFVSPESLECRHFDRIRHNYLHVLTGPAGAPCTRCWRCIRLKRGEGLLHVATPRLCISGASTPDIAFRTSAWRLQALNLV